MPTRRIIDWPLPAASLGNDRRLRIIHYGRGPGSRKAYIQAGLHADEAPGYLVMHHLMAALDRLDGEDALQGEIVLVPVANPIGVGQWRDDWLQGRFDFSNGINFNRSFPDLAPRIAERVAERLGADPAANAALIRDATADVLSGLAPPMDEAAGLKHHLLKLAHDADIVLDLHCDYQAVLHVYLGQSLWPEAQDLPAQLGARATLLADDSGVTPFDEACSRIWFNLARLFPQHPIPPACLAATVELRGMADLTQDTAAADAANLVHFLTRRGFIRGQAPELPSLVAPATPLTGVAHIRATTPGVVVFAKAPGDRVAAGDVVAEIVNPLADDAQTRLVQVKAATDGMLFARSADRFARPGRILAKIAGQKPLKSEGENLLTL